MYSGGNMLEDIAVGRAESICARWSIERHAWHIAKPAVRSEDAPIGDIAIATRSWCAPAIIPVDGVVRSKAQRSTNRR
jgi:hypothetical protein